ncbi:SGNH/GDSL hydrolase family protein [Leucobacter chinensis]|uniref:SGNH/GDSL hydrolase family protein n=1 Tax=Leucobacter chinensis TaxID=2851010 RepID=UPI001C229B2A|nr:SGNH/GDSL hydrolase family protein [Leucobacter chinensis]
MSAFELRHPIRYVAIGDSFTEGMGDERPDGTLRGWADLVAQGLADATGKTVLYANLAVRGRLLDAIIDEQLEPALSLKPTLLSVNGGGNDMLRPGTNLESILERTRGALSRVQEAGVQPLLLAGPNPTGGIPSGGTVKAKGDALVAAVGDITGDLEIAYTDNWSDPELPGRQYWSHDRLHLGPVGHTRVAHNVLGTLSLPVPADWVTVAAPMPKPTLRQNLRYGREHVLPWIGRRLTGRSSGDGRTGKHLEWIEVPPRTR